MATPAVFDTGFLPAGFTEPSYLRTLVRYGPNGSAPLFALSGMAGTKTATQVQHGYWTKTLRFGSITVGASPILAGDTNWTIVSNPDVMPGNTYRVQTTGEVIRVVSVASPTSIVVARAQGNVAAAGIAAGAKLYQVGTAFEQGSNRPNATQILPVAVTTFTQIFRNSWAVTGTAAATSVLAGEGNLAESKRDALFFHARDMETALFFGQKYQGVVNNQVYTQMDGLESVIRQYAPGNISTAGATTNYDQLEAMLDPVFNQVTDAGRPQERVLFCGSGAIKVIAGIGRKTGQIQLVTTQTDFGMQFNTFRISRGTFRMIEHPIFNTNPDWMKMAVAVDLSTFDLAYLQGRKTFHQGYGANGEKLDHLADNGQDAMGGVLTTELTTEIKNPPANAIIYGLTAAA